MSESTFQPLAALPAAIADRLRDIPTTHLSDNLGRVTGVVGLNRFHRSRKLVGRARTVKVQGEATDGCFGF